MGTGARVPPPPPDSRDYIAKRKPRKLLLPDIALQDDFEDSSVDSDE